MTKHNRWAAVHHPFITAPKMAMKTDGHRPGKCIASLRHSQWLGAKVARCVFTRPTCKAKQVFNALKIGAEEAQEKFGSC
jgi:aspartyl-tRNA synthetase